MKISHILIKQNNNLDLIRILLATMVIIGHTNALNGKSDLWIDPLYLFKFTYSGAHAVKLFFFISGLVVVNSYLNKKDPVYYIISRFFRILPLLFFVLIITTFIFGPIITNLKTSEYFSSLDSFSYIWKNMIFYTQHHLPEVFNENIYPNAVNGSLWSLRYEMGCYIIVLLLFLIFKISGLKNKYFLNIPILLIIIDSFFTEGLVYQCLGTNPEVNLTPASFALGALFAVNSDIIFVNFKIVVLTIILYYFFKDTQHNHILFIISTATIITYISTKKIILKLKPKYDISYGIYLWGFLIQQTINNYLGHIHPGLHFFLALIITLFLGIVSYIYIEKPFMILGKKLYKVYHEKLKHKNCVEQRV